MATAGVPLYSAAVRGSSTPGATSATSPSRTTRVPARASTSCSKSSPVSSRPRRRMVRSSSGPVRRPTGAARLWVATACTTCGMPSPTAARSRGLTATVISRLVPPTTLTDATPGIEPSSRLTRCSASSVMSTGSSVSEASTIDTIGKSEILNRDSTGSSSSVGRSARFSEILSRRSCVACWMSVPKLNHTTITP